jgi:hypothetical protein
MAPVKALAFLPFVLAACGGGGRVGYRSGDAGADASCTPSALPTFDDGRFEAITARSIADEPVDAGDYAGDFGDAPGYVPPVVHAIARARCDDALAAKAEETIAYAKDRVAGFATELDPEAILGALGFLETYRRDPRPDLAEAAHDLLVLTDDVLDLVDGYLPEAMLVDSSGEPLPYGQTAATALIPILGLRYVEVVDPNDEARRDRALQAIDDIAAQAWIEDLGYYRHVQGDDHLELYPNVAMMAAHALAHRVTGDAFHLERAEALYAAIQPLYLPDVGGYHSSYSSSAPDYVTLSSTNYLVLALLFLWQESGDGRHRDTAIDQLRFVGDVFFDAQTRIVYHDWEDGARADWYCAGCQFQHAYVLLLWGE